MVKYKNERQFVTAHLKSLKEKGIWVYKLPDGGFTLKPFDAITIENGTPFAIEFKYGNVNTYEKIYKMLRPNQIGGLKKFQESGGQSYVIGWDTKEDKEYIYKYKYLGNNKVEL